VELATPRLRIRDWRDDEVDRLFDMYSRWEVARFLGSQPRVLETRDQAEAVIERWRTKNAEDPRFGCWAIVAGDTVVGTVLFKLLPNSDGTPPTDVEIGWHLHPDSWGHGYATEAARAVIERAFAAESEQTGSLDGPGRQLGRLVDEVFAVVYPENTASLAVCRRLGMEPLGLTDRWYGMTVEAFRLAAPGRQAEHGTPRVTMTG
jgi:RimJ/RimL family protein N-acetyltransferase